VIAEFQPTVPYIPLVQVYAVADGHIGDASVKLVEKDLVKVLGEQITEAFRGKAAFSEAAFRNALKLTPVELKRRCENNATSSGTTLSMVLVVTFQDGTQKVYCANTGDSGAIAIPTTKVGAYPPFIPLSMAAKPADPRFAAGISKRGGQITEKRVNGFLGVGRGIGDYDTIAGPGINPRPKITALPIGAEDGLFCVVASDGLLDYVPEVAIVGLTRQMILEGRPYTEIAQALVHRALLEGKSPDNITAMVFQIGSVDVANPWS
jgi:serine/threonine protein phosphatase PrpC